jgi:hypothetical protein
MKRNTKNILLSCLFYIVGAYVSTYSQGHYPGGYFNPNDYFVPPPGIVVPVFYVYNNFDYYNNNGDKSDKIEIGDSSADATLNIEQNVKTNSFVLMMLYGGKKKIGEFQWGFMIIPTVNNPSSTIALNYYSNQTGNEQASFNNKTWGFGDLYVQPIWLSLVKKEWSLALSYGIWLPTGQYEYNDIDNVGLGYYSHNFRIASRYKPNSNIGVTGAITYETNQTQKDSDFKEASHLTIDYGACYTWILGHEVGLYGNYTTQLGEDKNNPNLFSKDQAWNIGAYGSYWIKPGKIGVLTRLSQNFGEKNRFGGFTFTIGLNFLFLSK